MFGRGFKYLGNGKLFKLTKQSKSFHVLGIESSCDDTSAAVINSKRKILGEGHFSQARIHKELGGIIPNVADHLHRRHIQDIVNTAIVESQINFENIDAIAVTVKPGLILSLTAGVEYAKDLCTNYQKPLIPIHHMEAHALTVRLFEDVKFPFLVLLISGGHCILAVAKSPTKFYRLGQTLDTSPGRAFDRLARRAKLINLKKYRKLCGGASIETAALDGDITSIPFSSIFTQEKSCNFSFCGLTTASINYIKKQEQILNLHPDEVIPDVSNLCASFQWAATKHLCQRLFLAITFVKDRKLIEENEKCLVVSGGVASNNFIRSAIKFVCDELGYRLVVPPAKYCTDNGVMVAWNGIERLNQGCPVVEPKDLSCVVPELRCALGEDLAEDVRIHFRCSSSIKNFKFKNFIEQHKIAKETQGGGDFEKISCSS